MPSIALFEFLIYILPGFIAVGTYGMYYPRRSGTGFQQATISLFHSLLILSVAVGLDVQVVEAPDGAQGAELMAVPALLLLVSGWVYGLVLILGRKLSNHVAQQFLPWLRNVVPGPHSVWEKVNDPTSAQGDEVLPKASSWALVFLNDGAIYRGYIRDSSLDPNTEGDDFLLAGAARVDDNLDVQYFVDGAGVYVRTPAVSRIEFIDPQTSTSET